MNDSVFDNLIQVPETEFNHAKSRNAVGCVPPSLKGHLQGEITTPKVIKFDGSPCESGCEWSARKLQRFISRYEQYCRMSKSKDRDHMLDMLEDVAKENNVPLPPRDRYKFVKKAYKPRMTVESVSAGTNDVKTMKMYYDGENFVGYVPGENKAKERETNERTTWDDLFDTLYLYLKAQPENSEKNKTDDQVDGIRMGIKLELIRQFYDIYGYDDKQENEPCPMFIERKIYNMSAAFSMRKKRFRQKQNQVKWTAWWTFTYDDSLISSEAEFRRKLLTKFRNLAFRRKWLIMGVFEHGEDNGRLHFHGFVYIPEGAEIGELVEKTQWSEKEHRNRKYIENTEFRELFGINEYEALSYGSDMKSISAYTTKMCGYMEKEREKIFYSRHIPSEFLVNLNESEVICAMNITCKRTIRRYVILDKVFTKTDTGVVRTAEPIQPPELQTLSAAA